jgi:fucose 4-O-acetylase-like acetyltransferase
MAQERGRQEWLDVLKGFGILFVVLGHALADGGLKTYIYAFHMPLFFFVSGYLFDAEGVRGYGAFIGRRFRSLIVPYLLFALVSYLFFLYFLSGRTGLGMAAIARTDGWHPFFLDRLYGVVYANSAELLKIGNTALWFLPCLFVMQAGFLLIHRATGGHAGRIWAVLVCLSLFAYYEIAWRAATLPWSIDRACRDMVFFGLGWSLAGMQRAGKLLLPESVIVRAGIWAAGTAVAAAAGLLQGTVRFGNYLLFIAAAVSGIAAWLAVAPLVRVKALAFLGRSALIIFGLHLLGQHLAAGTLSAAAGLFTTSAVVVMNDTLYAGIISLLEILITLPFVVLLTRALPGTFGGPQAGRA